MSGNQEQPPSSRSRKESIQKKAGEMLTQGQRMVEAGRERAQSVTEKLAAAAKDAEKLSAAMHTLSERMQALAQQAQTTASATFEAMKAKKAPATTTPPVTAEPYVPKGFSDKELDVIALTLLKETQQSIDRAIAEYPTIVHQLNADDPDLNLEPDIDKDFLHPLAPAEVELLKKVIKSLIRSEIGVGEAVNQLIAATLVNIRSRNAATLYVEEAPPKLPPRPTGFVKQTSAGGEARPPVPSLPRRIPSARLQGSLEDWTQAVRASGDHTDLLSSMSQAFRRSVRQSTQLPTIFDEMSRTISRRGSEDYRV